MHLTFAGNDRVLGAALGISIALHVMAMAVHPYNSGVPHRIKYFEAVYDYMRKKKGVWFTTGEEIYDWYRART